jgi:hypothetical protein
MLPGTTPGSSEVRRDTGNRSETRAGQTVTGAKNPRDPPWSVDVDVHSVPANSWCRGSELVVVLATSNSRVLVKSALAARHRGAIVSACAASLR